MVRLLGDDGFDGFLWPMKELVPILAEKARSIRSLGQHVAMEWAMMSSTITDLREKYINHEGRR